MASATKTLNGCTPPDAAFVVPQADIQNILRAEWETMTP